MSIATYDNRTTHPNAPDAGEISRYFLAGVPYYMKEDGIPVAIGVSVFGQNFGMIERTDPITNSTSEYVTYLTLNRTNCQVGKYRIGMQMTWRMNTTSYNFIGALFVDGVEKKMFEMESKDSGSDIRNHNSAFMYCDVEIVGDRVIELKFMSENSSYVATCYGATLEAWRVL